MSTNRSRFGFTPRARTRPVVDAQASTTGEPAVMHLYDPIDSWGAPWGVSAKEVVTALAAVDAEEIHLHINSPGGDVYEAIAITNALRTHKARVVAIVDGIAASAASFIAAAADELVMARNSELMIHDAWGLCVGNAGDMRTLAGDLDRISNNIASIYADRGTGTTESWRAAMLAETWYSAQEAVDAGLADRIDGAVEPAAKNREDLAVFARSRSGENPAAQAAHDPAPAPAAAVTTPAAQASGDTTQEGSILVAFTKEHITDLQQMAGVANDADEATIVAALREALAEQAEPTTPTASIPEGTVVLDAEQHQQLVADAAMGRQAREEQLAQARASLVDQAVNDGRIPPARREYWLNYLASDDEGGRSVLAAMPTQTSVPLAELGNADPGTAQDAESRIYAELFGDTKEA